MEEFQIQTQLQETNKNITNVSDDHVAAAPQLQPIFENPNSLIYNSSSSQNTPCFDPFDYNFTFPKPTNDFDFYECKPLIDHNNNNGVHAQVMDNFHGGHELSALSNGFSNFSGHKVASLPLDVMMMGGGDHQSHVMMSSSSLGFHQELKPVSFMAPDEVSSVTGYYSKKPNIQYHHSINIHQHHDMDRAATRKACTTKAVKKSNLVKGQWTIDEDRVLSRLVEQYGIRKWSTIAQMLPGRIGKQCRERWHNHLRPDIKKDTWSEEEDKVLIEAHAEIGNKWAEIAKRLPGRTENSIKNHWNATKRRQYSKRKCRSKYPRPSLLQDYIKSLNLDPGKSDRHKKNAHARQDHKTSQSSQSLEFCQTTTDRLVSNYHEFSSYEVPDFVFDDRMFEESCSIDSLLEDMSPSGGHDLGVLDEFQVKKELDLVEMMTQVNNN